MKDVSPKLDVLEKLESDQPKEADILSAIEASEAAITESETRHKEFAAGHRARIEKLRGYLPLVRRASGVKRTRKAKAHPALGRVIPTGPTEMEQPTE